MYHHQGPAAQFLDSLGRPWSLLEVRVPLRIDMTRCLYQGLGRQHVRVMIHLTYPLNPHEILHRFYVCDVSGIELNAPRKRQIERFVRRMTAMASSSTTRGVPKSERDSPGYVS